MIKEALGIIATLEILLIPGALIFNCWQEAKDKKEYRDWLNAENLRTEQMHIDYDEKRRNGINCPPPPPYYDERGN